MSLQQIESLKARMETIRKEIEAESKSAFSITSKAIFEKHPALNMFKWRQYTPYFNDGEECVFSAHTDEYSIELNGMDRYDDSYDVSLNPAAKEISDMLDVIGEGFLKSMFGDHCEVIAKRDGSITIEEYSHD